MQNKTSKGLHIDSLDRMHESGAERSWDMAWHELLLRRPPGGFCRSPGQPLVPLSCRRSCCPLGHKLCVWNHASNYFSLVHNREGWENELISAKFLFLAPRAASLPGSWRCHLHYQSTIALVTSCFPQLVLTRGNFMAPSILILDSWWIFLCPCLLPKPPFLFFLHLLGVSILITIMYYCLLFALH